jgi:hypothetical protein
VTLVSHIPGTPGVTANGASSEPRISDNGSTVVFTSAATDLVAGTDANGATDVFLYERATGAVTLVSHVPGAPHTSGNGQSSFTADGLAISADGALVAFESFATDLVAGTDTNVNRLRGDVFLYDRSTGAVTLVSHARGAPGTTGDTGSFAPFISADGRVVVLTSQATNLVDGDFNRYADVFAYATERDDTPPAPDGPDLVEAAVSDPPAVLSPGGRFTVTDTVRNAGNAVAAASTTRHYLSAVPRRTVDSVLLGGRAVGSLAVGASSQGSMALRLPAMLADGAYYVVSCADDLGRVSEGRESNNCTASASPVSVGRPDLLVTTLSDPPASATRGSAFTVTDTVENRGVLPADPSATRYYFSPNPDWGTADRRLAATRAVPSLAAGASFLAPAPLTLTVPVNMPAGTYFLLACADDFRRVMEGSEINNCKASAGTVTVP